MDIQTICDELHAKCLTGASQLNVEIDYAFASDFMSDVLTVDVDSLVLITGLCNLQTIRTAEMADIKCVVFVRNKRPSKDMLALAEEHGIVLLTTCHSMYHTSGVLFVAGLKSVF